MSINLTNILFVLVIFQLVFISLFLFTQQKGKVISNILLGCFFLTISLNLLDVFLSIVGVYSGKPYLAGWGSSLPLLFGPLIYLYVRSVLREDFSIASNWKHFLPFIIFFLGTEIYFLVQPVHVQQKIVADITEHHLPKALSIVSTLIFVQFLVYIIASLRQVSSYKREASQYFSSTKQTSVAWLSSTIIFFLVIVLITIVNSLLSQTSLAKYYLIGFNVIIFAVLIFILTVLLKALQKPYFFSFSKEDRPENGYATERVKLIEAERIEREKNMKTILNYMNDKKPYLEPELTLSQLALQLSLKPRVLSQTINEMRGQNFYDFINRYRIEEASRLLTNPKDRKITILEVLYEVGFNSKSSFNTLFRKYTGLTPTEFRKKQSS